MPRIIQNRCRDTVRDFQKELRMRQAEYDLLAIRQLSDATGIPGTTLWNRMSQPLTMRLSDLQVIVKVLHPDPGVMLAVMGYEAKDIKRFKER